MENGADKIGSEYILEIVGSEGRKLYYHCVLCDIKTEKIDEHKTSELHQINFLKHHYPSLIETLNNNSTSKASALNNIFNKIYNHHSQLIWNSPQVRFDRFSDEIVKEMLEQPHYYDQSDSFIESLRNLIKMENSSGLIIVRSETLTHERNAALQSMMSKRITKEAEKIDKKYVKLIEELNAHPDFDQEWRKFYLKYSYQLSALADIDVDFYNYINVFRPYFTKNLELRKDFEIYQKQREIKSLLKEQEMLEDISEESDKDFDVKIIEKPLELIDVSSDDEPPSKKPKVIEITEFKNIPQHFLLKSIEIAYRLIQLGEKPTVDGIKRAYSSRGRLSCDYHGFTSYAEDSHDFFTFSPPRHRS